MRFHFDYNRILFKKSFLTLALPLSLLFFSCHEPTRLEPTLEERAEEELLPTVKKILPYIKDPKVVEPKVVKSEDDFIIYNFYLSGKDADGNIIGGIWNYCMTEKESEDSSDDYVVGLAPSYLSKKDSSRYETNYPVYLNLSDNNSKKGSKNGGYIKKHDENGLEWFELVKEGKHGIVGENGAIIEPSIYDSIKYKEGYFALYYKYKIDNNKTNNGTAILDKDLYPIVPRHCFAHHAYRQDINDEGSLFYYVMSIDSCLSIDKKHYFGIVDSYGKWVFHPIFYLIHYNSKNNRFLPKNIPPLDFFSGTPNDYNFSEKAFKFDNMPLGAYIDRSSNRVDKLEEDLSISYYSLVKKYHRIWPSGEWTYSYLESQLPYMCVITYKDKLYMNKISCPMVLKYAEDAHLTYCQEFSTIYSVNNIVEINTDTNELSIHGDDGEIDYYREIDMSVINQQGKILDERRDYYLKRANSLSIKNKFGERRRTREELEDFY